MYTRFLLIAILVIPVISSAFMKKWYKTIFVALLSTCTIESLGELLVDNLKRPIKCVFLNNQPCKARPTIVNINSDQTLLYPFTVSVNKRGGSCNTVDNPYAGVLFQII